MEGLRDNLSPGSAGLLPAALQTIRSIASKCLVLKSAALVFVT